MASRSPQEVGDILKARREQQGMTQEDIPNVSSATVRKIENGTADTFRRSSVLAYMGALGWPADARDRLLAGEDPSRFSTVGGAFKLTGGITDGELELSSSEGIDFDELRAIDPDGYQLVVDQARLLLERARARKTQ